MEEVQQSSSQMMMIMKGKRTRRQRPMPPFNTTTTPTTLTYSSSSSACGDDYGNSFTSASYESTEEDEDMANCLILLAQGGAETSASALPKDQNSPVHQVNRVSGHVSKSGFFVYECKTCNRTFPSFQALGGHRASHKKPKTSDQHDKKPKTSDQHDKKPAPETTHLNDLMTNNSTSSTDNKEVEDSKQHVCVKNTSPPPPTQAKSTSISTKGFQISNKVKIHECSICGSEFSSGQALGGHMRRHRAIVDKSNITTTTTTSQMLLTSVVDNKKPQQRQKERSNILALDLNLPAPEDHDHHQHDSKFQFMPTQQTRLVFNAPALVDCHY